MLGALIYLIRSINQLRKVPGAIHLVYEDLCDPDFRSAELDTYFERAIRVDNPRPPAKGAAYVTNWDEFESYIAAEYRRMQVAVRSGSG